jgi:hypothetical protein
MTTSTRRQGKLNLVLLGGAAALAACQPTPNPYSTEVREVQRAGYASRADCIEDWGREEDCEEEPLAGSGSFFWGPYYSSAGHVYGYDGVTRSLTRTPSRAAATKKTMASESQIYSSGRGKYASVGKSMSSGHSASVARGGFGGGGRGGFRSFGG